MNTPTEEAIKQNNAVLDELFGLNTIIQYTKTISESYNGTKPNINFTDEWHSWKNQIKVPEDLSKAVTKKQSI